MWIVNVRIIPQNIMSRANIIDQGNYVMVALIARV